ncbi:hypothetical protein G6M85_11550 [Agrobacterium tumefaciens]|uniref:hypothetical protein n=1 Tax=Agrobacterium tumefaciens TaxID=358 RepID=UPI001571D49D|nr:hypothetical protein [Agrobacterium tumefaciens]NTE66242.1 hypothetical protein [Agrobacterium tumefaciens]
MDRTFPRPLGDIGNAGTFSFPVLYDVVQGLDTKPVPGMEQTDRFYDAILASCQRLVDCGVTALTTTSGYAALQQARLAAELPVPFASSSLVQLPTVFALLGPHKKLGVLAARAENLTPQHLLAAGVTEDQLRRVRVLDLGESPSFRSAIIDNPGSAALDITAAKMEISDLCKSAVKSDPDIGGFVAECANVGVYAHDIQLTTGLPVWDTISLVYWLHSVCSSTN